MGLTDIITEWLKQSMIDSITDKLAGIFDTVNQQVGNAAAQVGQTPQGFSSGVFSMLQNLSETVILPIAGMILTFILCYELITMIIEKNNMSDFDTFNIFKWIFKTCVAVYILSNTWNIVMAVFDVAQFVVNRSAGIISGSTAIDLAGMVSQLEADMQGYGLMQLAGLWLEVNIVGLCMRILGVCIFLVTYGRMIEIYMTVSIAPIPLSTMANREWGQMGNNYLKALFALGFQGFLMMVCIAIYAALIPTIGGTGGGFGSVWYIAGFTALLCFTLFKTGNISKSLFGAH